MKQELIISFKDQSASFSHGVELGRILNQAENGADHINNNGFPVRIENVKNVKDICKQYGYCAVFGKVHFNEWVDFVGIKNTYTRN